MKRLRIQDVDWFLDDERLAGVLGDLPLREGGRRSYFVSDFMGARVFIKCFVEKGIAGLVRNRVSARGKLEYLMGKRIADLSIPTPRPLGYGIGRNTSYIVEEWIGGDNLSRLLRESRGRAELFIKLAALLQSLTVNHIRHNDLHLDNILVRDERLYLIDLHKMQIKTSFEPEDEVSNLAHALAMVYDDMDEGERGLFFRHYGSQALRIPVEKELHRLKERWVERKKQRAFEDTSKIVKDGQYIRIVGMEDHGKDLFAAVVKDDKKVRVERFGDHIRKIYKTRRRLERAWKTHVALLYLNLSITPQVYYLKKASFSTHGFIAMEDLKDKGEELDRYLDRNYDRMDNTARKRFVGGLSDFLMETMKSRILHRDMKGCNIFVLKDGGFKLLDVEDIRFTDVDIDLLADMFVQLNSTIPKRIHMRDRVRFFLHFAPLMQEFTRAVWKTVTEESLNREIVYEGVAGLTREAW
jgi:tRNA A-37 threonylcarbamoyl transferase component Bud32